MVQQFYPKILSKQFCRVGTILTCTMVLINTRMKKCSSQWKGLRIVWPSNPISLCSYYSLWKKWTSYRLTGIKKKNWLPDSVSQFVYLFTFRQSLDKGVLVKFLHVSPSQKLSNILDPTENHTFLDNTGNIRHIPYGMERIRIQYKNEVNNTVLGHHTSTLDYLGVDVSL